MPRKRAAVAEGTDRKLAYAYAGWSIVLCTALALRAPTLEAWFWRSVVVLLMLAPSLRCALVYAYRTQPARLNWWLRPTLPAEREFGITWLIYAIILGVAPLAVLVI